MKIGCVNLYLLQGKVLRYTVDPPFPTESDTEEYEFLVKKMENDTKKVGNDQIN